MDLYQNRIVSIESGAFKDLVNLERLNLAYNMIETLERDTFVTMVNLLWIDLKHNKITFLSPIIFRIPGGKIEHVNLEANFCIDKSYDLIFLLESDIRVYCAVLFL